MPVSDSPLVFRASAPMPRVVTLFDHGTYWDTIPSGAIRARAYLLRPLAEVPGEYLGLESDDAPPDA